jgi:hypothetical protein
LEEIVAALVKKTETNNRGDKIYLWVHHTLSNQPSEVMISVVEVSHMAFLGDHHLWIAKYN